MIGRDWKDEEPDREDMEKRAQEYAQKWREDCYVYPKRGYQVYSQGPDLDHPKLVAAFVVKYEPPKKGAKHEQG